MALEAGLHRTFVAHVERQVRNTHTIHTERSRTSGAIQGGAHACLGEQERFDEFGMVVLHAQHVVGVACRDRLRRTSVLYLGFDGFG